MSHQRYPRWYRLQQRHKRQVVIRLRVLGLSMVLCSALAYDMGLHRTAAGLVAAGLYLVIWGDHVVE